MVPGSETDGSNLLVNVARNAAQITALGVAGDVYAAAGVLVLNHVRSGSDAQLSHVTQRDLAAERSVDENVAETRQVRAPLLFAPDGHIEDLLVFVDFA